MLYFKLFAQRIAKDFRQKELLPLKLLFFIHASTLFVLYPYLTIHMRELGINVEETAIMSAVIPVVAIIMPPVAGMVADKIGNFKLLLALFSSLGGLSALLLLIVPVGRITITYPDKVIVGLACNPREVNSSYINSHMRFSVYQEHICNAAHTNKYNTLLTIESCGIVCQANTNTNDSGAMLSARKFDVVLYDTALNDTNTFEFKLAPDYKPIKLYTLEELSNHRTLKNNENYNASVRKLSENSYFFPTPELFNFSCYFKEVETAGPQYNVSTGKSAIDISDHAKYYACKFNLPSNRPPNNALPRKFFAGIEPLNITHDDDLEKRTIFDVKDMKLSSAEGAPYLPNICDEEFLPAKHISVNVQLHDAENTEKVNKHLNLGSCGPRCIATTARKDLCFNLNTVVEVDMSVTFWSYMAVRVFIAMIGGTAFAMFEGAVIAILREKKADYGLQRIYASIGGMISSPVSGWLIDYYSLGKGYTDFRPAFYLYAVLKLASGFLMLAINLEFKVPATNVVADVISVLKKAELIALFISCFILGTAWGYIESFLFWLLQDLGGSRSLMGFTITVGGIAGIPLLVMSGPIIKKIGHANVIFIGFLFYGIRLLGYSLIYNPWHCLFFEAMESVTSSLSFTAAVTYAAKLSSVTTDSSIQGMLGGLYYGVGKGSGSLIGGYLMKLVGTRPTYQIFSAMTVFTGILYFCFNFFYLRKHREGDKEEDNPKIADIPSGFVEVELAQSWLAKPEEKPIEDGKVKKQNGNINDAFVNNDNEDKKTQKEKKNQLNTENENMDENNIKNAAGKLNKAYSDTEEKANDNTNGDIRKTGTEIKNDADSKQNETVKNSSKNGEKE